MLVNFHHVCPPLHAVARLKPFVNGQRCVPCMSDALVDLSAHSYVSSQQLPMSSFASVPTVSAVVGGGQSTTNTTTTTTDANNSALGVGAPVSLPPMSQPQAFQNGSMAPAPSGYSGIAQPVGGMVVPPGMSYQPSPQQPLL